MKPILRPVRWQVIRIPSLLLGALTCWQSLAVDPDLPFSSGSTGADGPLTFREVVVGGRAWHAMAYDATRERIVMFGGSTGPVQGDTWLFDGANWTHVLPADNPVQRYGARMVYDAARQEVVLFGGHRGDIRLNDTWVWNGVNWIEKSPASSPSPREYHAMVYDAARQEVVLHGGNSAASGNAETWTWNGSNWTLKSPVTSPPGHNNSALAFDAARGEVVLFGNHGQTWIWNGTTWTQRFPAASPSARSHLAMDYDPVRQEVILLSGSNVPDLWAWDGSNWFRRSAVRPLTGRQGHAMVWHGALQRMVAFGGDLPGFDSYSADTELWDGTTWTRSGGKVQLFDMSARPSGIWNFTSVVVPTGVTVRFLRNLQNTPVRWLASQDVVIHGVVDVSGDRGAGSLPPGIVPQGGPGGFAGGRGALNSNASGTTVGQPGQGPGGGAPGTEATTNPENLRDGRNGEHRNAYGNAFLQPLSGGSGGGGGSSAAATDGGNGGGGGGAILIASSRDILLNGRVAANGGELEWSGASQGGRGSGGAILLRADRVTGAGVLEAYGGTPGNPNGRIRVEAYSRTLTGTQNPVAVVGLPAENGELNDIGTLRIVSVDGVNVAEPPTGSLQTPDVVFADAGTVDIVVQGTGIPDGTPVRLRIVTVTEVIQPPPQNITGGSVTFSVTVPKGLGTLQATAEFAAP